VDGFGWFNHALLHPAVDNEVAEGQGAEKVVFVITNASLALDLEQQFGFH
jgi:hypothetical protein